MYVHIAAAGSYEPIRLSLPWLLGVSRPRALAESVRLHMQRALGTDEVRYQDVTLPPYALRVGAPYLDDAFFTDFAIEDASLLVDWFGLDSTTHVLDVGCGQCRLAIGIKQRIGTIGRYVGLDLDADSIDWGTRHLTSLDPAFEFEQLRVGNARYNPDGPPLDERFHFSFPDGSFDLVYMSGVSTHLDADEHRVYLNEFRRLLRPRGSLYLTAFVEDRIPKVTVNPEGYLGCEWSGPRNCIRYERAFFVSLLEDAGLRIERFAHRGGRFGASRIAARRAT
jgi:SAM-dependent methyltransferase